MDRIRIQKLPVDRMTLGEAVEAVSARSARGGPGCLRVYFLNAHCANVAWRDPDYRSALERAGLVLPDGSGIATASRMQGTGPVPNANGTDLFPLLMDRFSETGRSVFFLGATEATIRAMEEKTRARWPSLRIAGVRAGYLDDHAAAAREVAASGADVLFVGMGVPRQELWIDRHADRTGVAVVLAVGGLFDFYSDRMPRAPVWMRSLGIEWIFRLLMEPRRMWKRYLVGNIVFLARSVRLGRGGGAA